MKTEQNQICKTQGHTFKISRIYDGLACCSCCGLYRDIRELRKEQEEKKNENRQNNI